MEDSISHPLRTFRIPCCTFWINKCTCNLPGIHQPSPTWFSRRLLRSLPRRYPCLFQVNRRTSTTSGTHYRTSTPSRIIRQPQEMRILQNRTRIPRIHHQHERAPNGPCTHQNHLRMATPKDLQRHPSLFRLLQLLPLIHLQFLRRCPTTPCFTEWTEER